MTDPLAPAEWFFLLLVTGLATARVTRLIVVDEISHGLRRIAHRLDPRSRHIGFIVTCPYCAGVWAAAGVLGLTAIAVHTDGLGRWLAGAPVAIMAVAQSGLWLMSRDEARSPASTEMAPWPKGD